MVRDSDNAAVGKCGRKYLQFLQLKTLLTVIVTPLSLLPS